MQKKLRATGWEGWGGGRRGYVLLFKSVSFLSTSAFCVFLTMRSPLRLGKTAQPLFQSRVDGFCCSNFKIMTSSTLWSLTAQQFRAQMECRAQGGSMVRRARGVAVLAEWGSCTVSQPLLCTLITTLGSPSSSCVTWVHRRSLMSLPQRQAQGPAQKEAQKTSRCYCTLICRLGLL